jgi:hypothetical protein
MIEDLSPELVDNVRRAILDPMIGGWPLIHWEWVFSTSGHGRGIDVIGEWPESEGRLVTLRHAPGPSGIDRTILDE